MLPRRFALSASLLLSTLACDARPAADAAPPDGASATAAQPADDTLAARLRAVAARTGGEVGIAALHVGSGRRVSVNGDLPVFMASVVKLPLAVQVLSRVDRGELRLDDTVALRPRDLRVGRSGIADRHPRGVTLTVRELIRWAVSESDNTASDALLRLGGGPAVATAELRRLGVTGLRIDRTYAENSWQSTGVAAPPPEARWTPALIDSVTDAVPPAERLAAGRRFLADARDHVTADGAVALLAGLARGELLSPASRALLREAMTDTRNPDTRIVAGVPAGTRVAHKTGTWIRVGDALVSVNDVGLVALPDGGELAVAVLVRGATASSAAIDSAMAEITRLLYAHLAAPAAASAAVPGDTARSRALDARAGDVRLADDVLVRPLGDGAWLHVTLGDVRGPGGTVTYSSNGVLLETADGGMVLFDTAWTDEQTERLLRWAEERGRPVRHAVVTHAHRDRTGGLGALRRRDVPVKGHARTVALASAQGIGGIDSVPGLSTTPYRDPAGYELRFPGAGHTPDNIVVWLPRQRILHGGCLVKSDTATTVGNVADADVAAWPATVARVRAAYPDARLVVPGHGAVGGVAALVATERLIGAHAGARR